MYSTHHSKQNTFYILYFILVNFFFFFRIPYRYAMSWDCKHLPLPSGVPFPFPLNLHFLPSFPGTLPLEKIATPHHPATVNNH